MSLLFISFWEGYGVLEIAGELRGNRNIHYFGMLPIAINGSWNAPVTSVRSYTSEEDLASSFFWDAMWCHIL